MENTTKAIYTAMDTTAKAAYTTWLNEDASRAKADWQKALLKPETPEKPAGKFEVSLLKQAIDTASRPVYQFLLHGSGRFALKIESIGALNDKKTYKVDKDGKQSETFSVWEGFKGTIVPIEKGDLSYEVPKQSTVNSVSYDDSGKPKKRYLFVSLFKDKDDRADLFGSKDTATLKPIGQGLKVQSFGAQILEFLGGMDLGSEPFSELVVTVEDDQITNIELR